MQLLSVASKQGVARPRVLFLPASGHGETERAAGGAVMESGKRPSLGKWAGLADGADPQPLARGKCRATGSEDWQRNLASKHDCCCIQLGSWRCDRERQRDKVTGKSMAADGGFLPVWALTCLSGNCPSAPLALDPPVRQPLVPKSRRH